MPVCECGLEVAAVALCVLNGYGEWEKFHRKVQDVNCQFKRKVKVIQHRVLLVVYLSVRLLSVRLR